MVAFVAIFRRAVKVLYIHQHFALPDGAGGSRPWQFARRLAEAGHEVTVLCGGGVRKTRDIDGIRIVQLAATYRNSMGLARRVMAFLSFAGQASWVAARYSGDVFFASSTPLTTAIPGIIGSFLRRKPFVFEVRDLWPSVPVRLGVLRSKALFTLSRGLERLAYRRASVVVALAPSMREGVLQVWPFADVRMIPNACDFDLFRGDRKRIAAKRSELRLDGRLLVVYAGSFGESYRIPWLVELAAALPDVRFQIIGEGWASSEATSLCERLGLTVADILPGALSKIEVAERLAASDLVLSSLNNDPALQGNSLNKVFDAMAAGKAVLFNHDGWLSELLISKGAGWRLPDDIGCAAAAVRKIIADRIALESAGQRAEALGRSCFDRDMLFDEFLAALTDATMSHAEGRWKGRGGGELA